MTPPNPKRRSFHAGALALLLGAAAPAVQATPAHAPRPKTYVLVHGAWYGGWCWEKVASQLRAQGHTVSTPTCPGLGEQAHLLSKDISLTTFITSITNHILYQGISDVILVGSGFAGVVISGVADRIAHLINSLVYVDAMVLTSGLSVFEAQPAAITRKRQEQVLAQGQGVAIPVPSVNDYANLDSEAIAWVSQRLTPHPVGTYQEKLVLTHPLGNGRPRIYIDCTASPFEPLVDIKKQLRSQAGWTWVELDTHHDPMITDPQALSACLATV
ncbi:alpha/beta fold hydrolase [Massilia sp. DWR3-1-1]|uniref:alpha/beta fold hydrolase n=1 Tax=Massilia sp. DWR3-1-1 TaxID=2804559 RepID=UPI003CF0255E